MMSLRSVVFYSKNNFSNLIVVSTLDFKRICLILNIFWKNSVKFYGFVFYESDEKIKI